MYTNADSLKNKFNEFTVRISDYDPHIICVTEVKPKHMKDNLTEAEFSLKENGYNMFPLNINNNIGRGMLVVTGQVCTARQVCTPGQVSTKLRQVYTPILFY